MCNAGGGFGGATAGVCESDGVTGMADDGVTAAAAAAAYLIGGGRGAAAGRPALRILAMGCCAKFGFGGGFAVKRCHKSIDEHAVISMPYCLLRGRILNLCDS